MPEGKRTRIIYAGTESQSSLQMIRNYQKAFAAFGDYREVFSCQWQDLWKSHGERICLER